MFHFWLVNVIVFSAHMLFSAEPVSNPKSKAFNPDISANFLGIYSRGNHVNTDRTAVPHDGFSIQEAELQFTADVDVYFRAVSLLALSQEAGSTDFKLEPEELYLESLSLPRVTVKFGKFKLAMGKHNQLHMHAYPFLDAPLIQQQLLGDEGLNEVGVSAAFLLPAPWYSEVIVQGFNPSNRDVFNSPRSRDAGGLTRLKNLWDLSSDLTMELGLSGAMGKNQFDETATLLGSDLTFKWRPASGGKYKALIWSSEYLYGNRKALTDSTTGSPIEKLGGLATWVQWQFAERWWVQGRYEYVGLNRSDEALQPTKQKQSALLGFFPSEFSGFRLQYDHVSTEGVSDEDHVVSIQYNVSIGAHPAHAY